MITTVEGYRQAFDAGMAGVVDGLYGRLIRGRAGRPDDFEMLSLDADRRIVMLLGSDGLGRLLGLSGFEMLMAVGATEQHIRWHIGVGDSYKLVVFRSRREWPLADWDGALKVAGMVYPGLAEVLAGYARALKLTPFAQIEEDSGLSFHDIDVAGPEDPHFMTAERLLAIARTGRPTLAQVRAFLYFTMRLREYYAGDGYTADVSGSRGMKEYFALNTPLNLLGKYAIMDVDVVLPAG